MESALEEAKYWKTLNEAAGFEKEYWKQKLL